MAKHSLQEQKIDTAAKHRRDYACTVLRVPLQNIKEGHIFSVYVCMYGWMDDCKSVCLHVCVSVCLSLCMYVWMDG